MTEVMQRDNITLREKENGKKSTILLRITPPWREIEKRSRGTCSSSEILACEITESDAPHAAIRAGTTFYLCISASSEGSKVGKNVNQD